MAKKLLLAIIAMCCLIFIPAANAADSDWSWIQSAKGKSTNAVVNPALAKFLDSELPKFAVDFGFTRKGQKSSLREALLITLGGPPNPTVSPDENSIVLSACRPKNCDEKGFYWADAKSKTSVMAIVHHAFEGKHYQTPQLFLASSKYPCGKYPEHVGARVRLWLKAEGVSPSKIRCLAEDKVIESDSLLGGTEARQSYVDRRSKLEWSILKEPMLSWEAARKACADLDGSWKLPSKSEFEQSLTELVSIPEITRSKNLAFWSVTPYEKDRAENGRVYVLAGGKIELRDRDSDGEPIIYPVACVRGIPAPSN